MPRPSRSPTLYGRRKGHPLSARRQQLMQTLLPALALDLSEKAPPHAKNLFSTAVDTVALEIGFGAGEHLVARAKAAPATGYIGCEPFINGMASVLGELDQLALPSIRLHQGDAADVLDWLPEAALGEVALLYPDPWPKKRHWKRRFVSPANLDRLARAMRPGAMLLFASDIESYVAWTLIHFRDHPAFAWTAEKADDWRLPFPDWPGTRYEAKAIREGRVPAYLSFRRV